MNIDNREIVRAEETLGEAIYESVASGLLSEAEADELNEEMQEIFERLNEVRGISR